MFANISSFDVQLFNLYKTFKDVKAEFKFNLSLRGRILFRFYYVVHKELEIRIQIISSFTSFMQQRLLTKAFISAVMFTLAWAKSKEMREKRFLNKQTNKHSRAWSIHLHFCVNLLASENLLQRYSAVSNLSVCVLFVFFLFSLQDLYETIIFAHCPSYDPTTIP